MVPFPHQQRAVSIETSVFSTTSQLGLTYLKSTGGYSVGKVSLGLFGFPLTVLVTPEEFWIWHLWVGGQSKTLHALVFRESTGRVNF